MSLLTDRKPLRSDHAWERDAFCFKPEVDPDLWWSSDRKTQGEVRHICLTHCPVQAQCALMYRPCGGETAAGVSYSLRGKPLRPQPRLVSSCVFC